MVADLDRHLTFSGQTNTKHANGLSGYDTRKFPKCHHRYRD